MLSVKPNRRVTNSQWSAFTAQQNRIEEGLNRLLEHHGLQQTGQNQV